MADQPVSSVKTRFSLCYNARFAVWLQIGVGTDQAGLTAHWSAVCRLQAAAAEELQAEQDAQQFLRHAARTQVRAVRTGTQTPAPSSDTQLVVDVPDVECSPDTNLGLIRGIQQQESFRCAGSRRAGVTMQQL